MIGAEVSEKFFRNPLERDQARGNLASDRGIDRDVVVRIDDHRGAGPRGITSDPPQKRIYLRAQ
jgi:hypothetical protein